MQGFSAQGLPRALSSPSLVPELTIAREPTVRSRLVHLVEMEKAREMGQALHLLLRRVPLAKQWLSLVLRAAGLSVADIARTIRASEVSVRKMLPTDLRVAACGKKVSDVTPPGAVMNRADEIRLHLTRAQRALRDLEYAL